MTATSFVSRVTLLSFAAIVAVSAVAAWLGGRGAAVGIAAGGAIALLNFRWLARSAAAAVGAGRGLRALALFGLRYLASFGALAVILGARWADPLAVIVGLSVLPPVLITAGLRAADVES
jgi:hypothetical protein